MHGDKPPTIGLQHYPFVIHPKQLDYLCQHSERKWTCRVPSGERKRRFKSKKTGCNAKMVVKEVSMFGNFHVHSPHIKRNRIINAQKVRHQLQSGDPTNNVRKRFYIRVDFRHNTHPRHKYVGVNNRIHPLKAKQIQQMAVKGIRSVGVAKLCLGYIASEDGIGNRLNPTSRTIVNHLAIGARKARSSENDQLDLLILVTN